MSLDIRKVRTAMGLTVKQFAKKVGVHGSSVSRWEAGTTLPRMSQKLEKVLAEYRSKYQLSKKKVEKEVKTEEDKNIDRLWLAAKVRAPKQPAANVREGYVIRLANRKNVLGGPRPVMFCDKDSAATIANDHLVLFGYDIVRARIKTVEEVEILS